MFDPERLAKAFREWSRKIDEELGAKPRSHERTDAMLPYIILYRVRRGHWVLAVSPRMPIWYDHQQWNVPPGDAWNAHVDVVGAAAERLDVTDYGPYPCFAAFPGGAFAQIDPPRYVLRETLDRICVNDLETDLVVWSRGWRPETYEDVKAAAVHACEGMNDRVERRRLQEITSRIREMERPEDAFPDIPR